MNSLLRGGLTGLGLAAVALSLVACGARQTAPEGGITPQQLASEAKARQQADEINTQLAQQSSLLAASLGDTSREYRIGPGDALDVDVFQVEELSGTLRVNARGEIMMPLLGPLPVAGRTAAEVEDELTQRLGADYLQNPQVTVFVSDYRSAEVIVAGAVRSPAVYSVTRPHTLLEILLLAGGVSDRAGYKVNVHTKVKNPDTGRTEPVSVMVDLRTLMNDLELNRDLVLSGGDSVFVQRAGYVYIQGAVPRPGSFKIDGEIDVLKALSLAGGVRQIADYDEIKVFREGETGTEIFEIDYNVIREDRSRDIVLEDGDLILVGQDAFKSTVAGVWNISRGIIPWITIL